MNIRNVIVPLVCAASQVAFGATPDGPSELRSVTVASSAIRTDIRKACPDIDAQLQHSLSSAWGRMRESMTIPVQFRVEGNQVTQTRTSIAAIDYRPFVRAAMSKLDCEVASGEARNFKFLLVMLAPDDLSSPAPLALALQGDR